MTGINRRGLLKGSIFGMAAAGASVIPVAVYFGKDVPSGRQHDFCRRSLQRHQHLCPESAGTLRHDRRFLS